MPTQTFWNLPADKRDTLTTLAIEEFANNDYDTASLSRIVARAGIAKGSVYQYFADKRDLFLYIFEYASQTLLEAVEQETVNDGELFFTLLRRQMSATTRTALAYPQLARIVQRTYLTPPPFMNDVVAQGQALRQTYFRKQVERAAERGEISRDLSPDLILLIIDTVTSSLGPFLMQKLQLDAQTLITGDASVFDSPAVEEAYDQVVRILSKGLSREE